MEEKMCLHDVDDIVIDRLYDADDSLLNELLAEVEKQLDFHDCNPKQSMMIMVIVEEIFVNIAHYAYPDSKGNVHILLGFKDDDMIMSFNDRGIPFDPLAKEDPDIHAGVEEREIGGLGIYMMKKSMDEVDYKRVDDHNILTIRKNIHK